MIKVSRLVALLSLGFSPSLWAVEATIELGMEAQVYAEKGPSPTHQGGFAVSLQPTFTHAFDAQAVYFTFEPFFRFDQRDAERNHADIREFKAIKVFNDWEFEAGIGKVFWGVAESNHLVDVINQTDSLEGLDGEDKLGQPLLRASRIFDQSTLSLWALPYFRAREFLSAESRLSLPFPVNTSLAQYESEDEEAHIDYAVRFNGYLGQVDYGVSWFDGTARDPQLRPASAEGKQFLPFYEQISRVSLDVQYTADAWLWKLEAMDQRSKQENFTAYVGGLEYTVFGLNDGAYDLGLLAEVSHDSRGDPQSVALQNDLFIAARFGFNDAESSAILVGSFIDLDDNSRAFRIEANRRIFDGATVSLEAQVFSNTDSNNQAFAFRDNDFIKLELAWFF